MKTIAFANRKGGVGKTSVCLHTAGVLAEAGKRVLIISTEVQERHRFVITYTTTEELVQQLRNKLTELGASDT